MNLSLHAFEMEMEDDTHAYQFPPVASTKTSETLSMILDAAEAPEAVESLKELEALPLISAQRTQQRCVKPSSEHIRSGSLW